MTLVLQNGSNLMPLCLWHFISPPSPTFWMYHGLGPTVTILHTTSLHRIVTHTGTPSYAANTHTTPYNSSWTTRYHTIPDGTIQYHTRPAGTSGKLPHLVKPPLSQLAPPGTTWRHLAPYGPDGHRIWAWRGI
jgi:hypothetical protein